MVIIIIITNYMVITIAINNNYIINHMPSTIWVRTVIGADQAVSTIIMSMNSVS